jgi:uncharacterized membrane protein YdjX (TVP38/TMEM64 family)
VIALVAGVAALAVIALLLPLDTLPEAVLRLGPVAPVAGVLVGAALLVALVPRTPVSVACGLLFGAALGAVTALAVMVVAATVTFVAGRLLGRGFLVGWAQRLAGRRAGRVWDSLQQWIAREGVLAVAAVRSLPLAPYGLIGYAYGASNVRVRVYAFGSALAGSPSAVTYALLGAALPAAGQASPFTLLPLAIGILLTTAVTLRTRAHLRKQRVGGGGGPR